MTDNGVPVEWEGSGSLEGISPGVQHCAYRVVQKADERRQAVWHSAVRSLMEDFGPVTSS